MFNISYLFFSFTLIIISVIYFIFEYNWKILFCLFVFSFIKFIISLCGIIYYIRTTRFTTSFHRKQSILFVFLSLIYLLLWIIIIIIINLASFKIIILSIDFGLLQDFQFGLLGFLPLIIFNIYFTFIFFSYRDRIRSLRFFF